MSIGLGIFASVVLILAVYHKGFRMVLLWSGAIFGTLALLCAAAYFGYDRYATWKADRAEAQAKAKDEAAKHEGIVRCMSRLGTPWLEGSPTSEAALYARNLQACEGSPDDYDPFAQYGGQADWDAIAKTLPRGYTLDQSNRVVYVTNPADASDWKDVPPCPDNSPAGVTFDGPCVLSNLPVVAFRREMCVGTIQPNGDCVTEIPPGAQTKAKGKYMVQICPYGLGVNADGQCPSWKDVDVKKEQEKLLEYRKR